MSYYYIDAKRESDPYTLADLEVILIGVDDSDFIDGQMEACIAEGGEPPPTIEYVGWWYAYGSPGYLWDSDPVGPFESEEEALTAAREAAGFCEHGISDEEICEDCPAPELWVLVRIITGTPEYVSRAFNIPPELIQKARKVGADLYWGQDNSKALAWSSEDFAHAFKADHKKTLGGGWLVRKLSDADARRWGRSD